jgi:hypothetical protein
LRKFINEHKFFINYVGGTKSRTKKMVSKQERELVRKASLDEIALTTQRSLTQDEFLDVIAYADALQRFDERREDEKLLASATDSLFFDEGISLPVVYQIARELSIPDGYVERALAIRHPSVEQQLADIRNHRAIPSVGIVAKTYEDHLLTALRSAVPTDKFDIIYGQYDFYNQYHPNPSFARITETEERSKFLFWERVKVNKKSSKLADFNFTSDSGGHVPRGKFGLTIALRSPLFLRACSETLERLNEEFKDQMQFYDIRYHYTVE